MPITTCRSSRQRTNGFSALPGCGSEVLPNVHAYGGAKPDLSERERPRPAHIIGEVGWYMGDMACALGSGTWNAVYRSAQSAIAAARDVLNGAEEAFALCRPPGHHAYQDRASGFCFLNNAAIAAEVLLEKYNRVGIIDFDTHHGDGTQAIFYRRSDVFYASTHTDPREYYPFYYGYSDEDGFGEGDKYNLNIPLAAGADDEAFIDANQKLIVAALAAEVEALVLSAGVGCAPRRPAVAARRFQRCLPPPWSDLRRGAAAQRDRAGRRLFAGRDRAGRAEVRDRVSRRAKAGLELQPSVDWSSARQCLKRMARAA